jgi:nucleotide-binding universal stress UspA family protein
MFTKILIGSDGSQDALRAAHLAALIAQPTHAEVIVTNAFNLGAAVAFLAPDAMACSEVVVESGESAQKDILQRTSDFLAQDGVTCRTRAEIGHPVEATLRVAEEEKADLIVLGSHGLSGFQKFLLGGVADGVAQHAPCPVLIVRGKTSTLSHILVAVDGSERSYKALVAASEIAQPLHATISVLHVLDASKPFPGIDPADTDVKGYALLVRKAVTERVDAILKEKGIDYRIYQDTGHPVEVITAFAAANQVDLIAMGSHGLGTFQRLLLGSVSYAVLHHAVSPVLIVR